MSIPGRRNVVSVIWTLVGLLLIWRGLPYAGVVEDPEIVGLTGCSCARTAPAAAASAPAITTTATAIIQWLRIVFLTFV